MASQILNSDQQVAIGITSGLLVLTTFVVYFRLYIRCILKARLPGWDDLTVFIAWVMALGASIATYVEIESGLGRHLEDLSPDQLYRFNACRFAAIQLYIVGLTSVKLSFLVQYYRTFDDRTIRRICMCFAFYCSLWMIVQAILHSFSCIPIQYLFPDMADMCILSIGIWSAMAMINVLTDFIIFCIPIKPLWRKPLLNRQKYLLAGIFFFGFIICAISVARIPTLRHTASSADHTSTYAATALLSLAELELAIICTSLPVLRPMIANFVPGVSPPDPSPTASGTGSGSGIFRRKKRGTNHHDESLLNTNLSGSTVTTNRSFFKSLINRDEDREDEHPVLLALAEAKRVETRHGQKDEKKLASPKIVEVTRRKRDKEHGLDAPMDFFHPPSLHPQKSIKKTPAIVPRDLRLDASTEDPSKASAPMNLTQSISQSSSRKPLSSPVSPHPGDETIGQIGARIADSFLRLHNQQGDEIASPESFSHTCKPNTEAVKTRNVCGLGSPVVLPDRFRSPGQPLPHLPSLGDLEAKDAGTQTLSSRARRAECTSQQRARDTMVTQSTQTAMLWESSSESSRPPSPQTQTSGEDRVDVEVAQQGTIARARERAMQAIANKTYGQAGEIHQGRARVVQVDTAQRRQAAIGIEEVLGLDFDQSPRPIGDSSGRKEATKAAGAKPNRPVEVLASKRVQTMESALASIPRREGGPYHEGGAQETLLASRTSPWQVVDAGDQAEPTLSATEKRSAATSWLRLSTDYSL